MVWLCALLRVAIEKLRQDLKQSFENTESLIRRQAEFELFVREKLQDITVALKELLFLAPVSQTLPGGDSWALTDEATSTRLFTPGEQSNTSEASVFVECSTCDSNVFCGCLIEAAFICQHYIIKLLICVDHRLAPF